MEPQSAHTEANGPTETSETFAANIVLGPPFQTGRVRVRALLRALFSLCVCVFVCVCVCLVMADS